ncbi:MAG: hypothetical protein N3C57_08110 [Aquificaceae bacterium]|nr:hypothetical protein [Aquificaceae bacterium]MCX8076977.1 hypothetical protein [Aquificaceae bacterium]
MKEKGYLLTERVNLFLYKVWFLEDVLDLVDELKLSASKGKASFLVKLDKAPYRVLHAGFESLVNKYTDIENIIESLGEPYNVVIMERLFLENDKVVKERLGLCDKKQARELVKTSVNKAYSSLRRYLG